MQSIFKNLQFPFCFPTSNPPVSICCLSYYKFEQKQFECMQGKHVWLHCFSKMDHTLLIHYFLFLLLYEIGWFIVQNRFDFCKQNHYSFVDIHRFAKPTAPTWISQTMRKYSTWNMFRPNVVISAEFIRQFNVNLEQHHNQHTYHEWNNENRKHDRLSWLSFCNSHGQS